MDIKDYADSMKERHKILTQSLLYSIQRKKALPPFTFEYLKAAYTTVGQPKWETLNSEMNESNKNLLDYLQTP